MTSFHYLVDLGTLTACCPSNVYWPTDPTLGTETFLKKRRCSPEGPQPPCLALRLAPEPPPPPGRRLTAPAPRTSPLRHVLWSGPTTPFVVIKALAVLTLHFAPGSIKSPSHTSFPLQQSLLVALCSVSCRTRRQGPRLRRHSCPRMPLRLQCGPHVS